MNEGRRGFKRFIIALAAMLLTASMSITALADGNFAGDIIITETVEGYEYKIYEVLDCIAAGGDDSVFMAAESWKEFLKTNENAMAMLIPKENDGNYPMADEGSELYTVNLESDKATRQAFAADVLEYARENGVDAYGSITAEGGEGKVIFEYVPLGIYVIDTADRARITVMWDMDWQSEIKESYKPETEAEEKSDGEDMAEDTPLEAESGKNAAEEPLTAEEEAPKAGSKTPVIIVTAVGVLALVAILIFAKKKKQ